MKIFKAPTLTSIDGDAVLHEARVLIARKLDQPSRRAFLQRSLTLGGLSLLTGCSISDNTQVEAALTKISRFNDKVQGLIFSPSQLAPTYTEAEITRPFPFNAFYGEDEVREVDEASYKLEVTGMVSDRHAWTLAELRAMPQHDQITRHICVEGWSAIGKWGGVRLQTFCATSARTPRPSTSASSARTTTTPASTCPPRCTRRRCSRSPTTASRCRPSTAFR